MITHKGPKRKTKLLEGTVEEQLEQVERALVMINRRTSGYVVGMLPRVPVMEYVEVPDEDGVLIRKLFPLDCIVTSGYMFVEKFDKSSGLELIVSVESSAGGSTVKIPVDRSLLMIKPDMPIAAGQRLIVAVNKPELCSKVWLGFMLEVSDKNMTKDYLSNDIMLALLETSDEDLTNA